MNLSADPPTDELSPAEALGDDSGAITFGTGGINANVAGETSPCTRSALG
jgi:hypothetical protein